MEDAPNASVFQANEATGDKEKLTVDQIKLRRLNEEYKRLSKTAGLRTQNERAQVAGFGRGQAARATAGAEKYYQDWSKSIGVNSSIKTLANYYDVKYTDSPRYELLKGYARAVEKADISPLVGFEQYERVNSELLSRVIRVTAENGITVESVATHFIDRVIGQTSTPHSGMRCGVPIDDVLDTLKNTARFGNVRLLENGDIRQTLYGNKASITMSIRDKRLIQANPWKEKLL